jgi:hypothetical protein
VQISPLTRKRRSRRRARFDPRVRRRREIEAHAIHVGAADTDDFDRWLIAWIWHNSQSKDQIGAVIGCASRMGRNDLTLAEAEAIIEEASLTRRHLAADNLARFLGVTYKQRERLGLTTIGALDVGKRARRELRKRKDRLAKERKRREQGARPQALSLSRTEPWKAEGISRRQWYRRRKSADEAMPPRADETVPSAMHGTTSGTAVLLLTADETVPSALPPESGCPSVALVAAAVPIAVDGADGCSRATFAVDGPVRARLARDGTRRGLEKDWSVRARVLLLLDSFRSHAR